MCVVCFALWPFEFRRKSIRHLLDKSPPGGQHNSEHCVFGASKSSSFIVQPISVATIPSGLTRLLNTCRANFPKLSWLEGRRLIVGIKSISPQRFGFDPSLVSTCGIYGGKSGNGACLFSELLGILLSGLSEQCFIRHRHYIQYF
jgi:hypothetical protein